MVYDRGRYNPPHNGDPDPYNTGTWAGSQEEWEPPWEPSWDTPEEPAVPWYQTAPPPGYQQAPPGYGPEQPPPPPGPPVRHGAIYTPGRPQLPPGPSRRAFPPEDVVLRPGRDYREAGGPPRGRRSSRRPRDHVDQQTRLVRTILWFTTGKSLVKLLALLAGLLLAWQFVGGVLLNGSPLGRLIHSPVGIVESVIHGATKTTTSDTVIGNAILDQVVGLDKPPLGQANLSFDYEHKVDKSKLFWKCWYAQDYHAEATGWAYVALNPGAKWWAKSSGHYIMHRQGHQVSVVLKLPQPTLAPTVHQVSVDMTLSHAVGKPDHSFSYPGLGCGTLIDPHFSNDEMGKEMQTIAYSLVTGKAVNLDGITMLPGSDTSSAIRQRLFNAAKAEAQKIWAIDAVGPTVARYGDHLRSLQIVWVLQSPN